jgi:hypothetical protein
MASGQQIEVGREELANAITHGFGLFLSIAGAVALVAVSILRGTAWHIVSCAGYGFTLVLLYLSSTLYHAVSTPHLKQTFRFFDHSAVYLLIAGTYTPFTLVEFLLLTPNPVRPRLPDEWDESEAGAEAVFRIAGQFLAQNLFFVEETENDQRDEEKEGRQSEVRAECQGREEHHCTDTQIHGMAHEGIRPGGNHPLTGLDLNGAGCKTVDLDDPKRQQVTAKNNDL